MLHLLKTTVKIKKKYKFVPGKPFNPNFDGNLLAWYDGDTLATDPANTWSDCSANGYDLTLFNAPSIINNAINGHDALQFDGINQYGRRAGTPVRTQPITIYIVLKQTTWTIGDIIINSDGTANQMLSQAVGSPQIWINAGATFGTNPNLALNTYGIITAVFNGANSELRTNNNASVNGNAGVNSITGLTLAAQRDGLSNYCNIEVAYLILRNAADNTSTQNIIINALKARFSL